MEKKVGNKEAIEEFRKELSSSPLLNTALSNFASLELISADLNGFFENFSFGRPFSFTSFFDKSISLTADKTILSGKEIIKKDTYSKDEIEPLINKSLLGLNRLISCSLPLIQDQTLESFKGKDDIYLSFGNLFYAERGKKSVLISPLVFFKVEIGESDGEYTMKLNYNSPLFNTPLIWKLKQEYNLDISYQGQGFDPQELAKQIAAKVTPYSFAADDSLHLMELDVMKEIRLEALVSYFPSMASDPLFRCFEERLPNEKTTSYASKKEHPAYIVDGLNTLASYPVMKIDQLDPMNSSFLKSAIDEYILHKNSILIVCPDKKSENEWNSKLMEDYYDAFMPYQDITEPGVALFTLLETAKNHPQYLLDASLIIAKENLREAEEKQRNDDLRLKTITIQTGENDFDIYNNLHLAASLSRKTYDFSAFSDYDFDNWLDDGEFLSFLKINPWYKEHPFTEHPFYGLNSAVQKGQYEEIVSFLKNMIADIAKFEKAIEDSRVRTSHWSDFNSLRDYDEAVKIFSIYSKYDGFPISYFKVDFSQDIMDSIIQAEGYYRTEASLTLSLDVLCRPLIWNMDFDQIIEDFKDHKKERQLKKELKDVIKITPFRRAYKTLIVFVDKYQDNHKKILAIRPKLEKVFGKAADTLDGLLNVNKACDFIQMYNRHKKLYDHLDFSNPFTEEIFKDQAFSDKYKSTFYPSLMEGRTLLEHDLDKYREYFNEDKFDFFQSSFIDIRKRLAEKMTGSEEMFDSYLEFSQKADASSKELRSALDEVEKANDNLKSFNEDYLSSVYKHMLLQVFAEEKGDEAIQAESADLFDMYRLLQSDGELLSKDIIKSFDSIKSVLFGRPSFRQAVSALKERYHSQRMLSAKEALTTAGDVFFHIYPLHVASLKQCEYLQPYKFDLAIVDLREDNSLLDLYSSLMLARRVIILGDAFPLAKQVPSLDLSLDDDMKSYAYLSHFPPAFQKSVNAALIKQGITLEKFKDVAPGILIPYYFEKGEERFALRFFDQDDPLSYAQSYALPTFLFLNYGIKTVNLYALPFLVYPDLSVMSCWRDVKTVVEGIKKIGDSTEKLSYEEKKKAEYFKTLKDISYSFPPYHPEEKASYPKMMRSKKETRPIRNIAPEEIALGILAFLSRFTYLNREVLVGQLAEVVGTNEKDVDFRLLFQKAENLLLGSDQIKTDGARLALKR